MDPQATVILTALLALLLSDISAVSNRTCVEPCNCNGKQVRGDMMTFHLECGRDFYIRAVPDWSGLTSVGKPIAISLYVDKLRKLRREDFPAGLDLVSVDIVGNTHVDPDAFQNVRDSLTDLQLHSHKLNLSGTLEFLQGLTKLRRLVLINVSTSDKDQHVSGSLFAGLGVEKLEYLQITDSRIASFGNDAFRDLGVEEMSLASNRIAQFPGAALQKVKNLRTLDLFNNKIRHLRKGDTDGLSLEWLSFASNEIASVEVGALTGLHAFLETLRLDDNKLSTVPTAALAPLQRLQKLDLSRNAIVNVTRAFEGNYCLQELNLGSDDTRIEHISADAFNQGGKCLHRINLVNIKDFPSQALRVADAAREVIMTSKSLTALRAGALSGVHVWSLSLEAPLQLVEPGAFDNMTYHPVSLTLQETHLTNISFFFSYPAGTFTDIHVSSSELPCDCELAGVQHNLKLYDLSVDFPSTRDLTGTCDLEGNARSIHDQDVREIFSECSNFTILLLPQEASGSDVTTSLPRSVLLVVVIVALGRLW